jgi:hypothetical protein
MHRERAGGGVLRVSRPAVAFMGKSIAMNRRILFALVALGGALLLWPAAATAQKNGKGGEELEIEGTIAQVTPQGLVVQLADGTKYLVGAGRSSQVTLQGKATKECMVQGSYLEFEVELDHAWKSTMEVAALTIVSFSNLNPAGLFPQSVLPRDFIRDENARAMFVVRGKMLAPRNGMLVVHTGQKIISTKLAPTVALSARFDNWALASPGDTVIGTVDLRPQPNTGLTRVTCKKLTIDAAEAISPPASKPAEAKSKVEPKTRLP